MVSQTSFLSQTSDWQGRVLRYNYREYKELLSSRAKEQCCLSITITIMFILGHYINEEQQ